MGNAKIEAQIYYVVVLRLNCEKIDEKYPFFHFEAQQFLLGSDGPEMKFLMRMCTLPNVLLRAS